LKRGGKLSIRTTSEREVKGKQREKTQSIKTSLEINWRGRRRP